MEQEPKVPEAKEYVGPNEVASKVILDKKTPQGNDFVQVNYVNGKSELYTKKMLEKVITNEPSDLTALRNLRIYPVTEEMIAVATEYGVKRGELNFLSQMFLTSLSFNIEQAEDKLWGKRGDDVLLSEVDDVLKRTTVDDVLGNKLPDSPQ